MSRPSESSVYEDWMGRISAAETLLDQRAQEWDKYLRYYRMTLSPDEKPREDSVWVNYFFGLSRIIIPSIYYRNPEVLISPRGRTPWKWAKVKEELVNFHLEEIGFEAEARRVILDAFYCGIGVVKVGFPPRYRPPRRKGAWWGESLLGDLFGEEESPSGEEDSLPFEGLDDRVSSPLPYAIRVNPKFFLVDPLAKSLSSARWVVHRILRPVSEVRRNRRYTRSLTSGIEPSHAILGEAYLNQVDNPYPLSSITPSSKEDDLVMLYEVYDRESRQILVMDEWNMVRGDKKFLRKESIPEEEKEFPYEVLVFNEDPEDFYGVSDVATWFNPSRALNLLNSMQYRHVKRFNRKYVVEKGRFDPSELDRLQSPEDGTVVQSNGPAGDSVAPVMDATVTPDLYALREVLRNELTLMSGTTQERRGGGAVKTQTATEASIVENQARVRDSDRLYLVSQFVKNIARKLLRMDGQCLDSGFVAFLTEPEALVLWEEQAPNILKSPVDVRVRVGSSAFYSQEVRTKLLLDFFNLAARAVDPATGMPLVNLKALVQRIGDSMGIEDLEELLAVPLPPIPPGLGGGMPGSPGVPGMGGLMGAGGAGMNVPLQSVGRRTGAPDLASLLSGVQNFGPGVRGSVGRVR